MTLPFLNKVGGKDKAFLARQLATLLNSGIPITKALLLLAEQESHQVIKKVLIEINNDLEAGMTFSAAITKHEEVFDRVFVNVVISGEAVGNLNKVLEQLADQMEKEVNFANKVRGAFAYPLFVAALMVFVGVIMMIYIVPQLKQVFEEAGAELPWTTQTIIALSTFLQNNLFVSILILALLIFLLSSYAKSKAGERIVDYIKLKLPANLGSDIYMARFSRTLSMLAQGGTPIIESINVTANTMNNMYYREVLSRTAEEVKRGNPLSVPLMQSSLFPSLVGQMLVVGEQTGSIEQVLTNLADHYEELVDTKLKGISGLIEPVIIVVVGIAVGFLIYSILIPLYNIAQL